MVDTPSIVLLHGEEARFWRSGQAAEGMAERIGQRGSWLFNGLLAALGEDATGGGAALELGGRDAHAAHDLARAGAP